MKLTKRIIEQLKDKELADYSKNDLIKLLKSPVEAFYDFRTNSLDIKLKDNWTVSFNSKKSIMIFSPSDNDWFNDGNKLEEKELKEILLSIGKAKKGVIQGQNVNINRKAFGYDTQDSDKLYTMNPFQLAIAAYYNGIVYAPNEDEPNNTINMSDMASFSTSKQHILFDWLKSNTSYMLYKSVYNKADKIKTMKKYLEFLDSLEEDDLDNNDQYSLSDINDIIKKANNPKFLELESKDIMW